MEIKNIVEWGRETEFHDSLLSMIEAMGKAQQTVREAYYSIIAKDMNSN